jgi:hypothetical protein
MLLSRNDVMNFVAHEIFVGDCKIMRREARETPRRMSKLKRESLGRRQELNICTCRELRFSEATFHGLEEIRHVLRVLDED